MSNIREDSFNQNVIEVYTEEPGFTGYKGFEFNKIDDVEELLRSVLVTGQNLPSGLNVYQANLDKDLDNVSVYISGDALSYLSGIVTDGVSLKGVNTVNVNVTGGNLTVSNEVEIINASGNPIPISGKVTTSTEKSSNISNFTSSGLNGVILGVNSNRKELFIQNLSTEVLYVKYGEECDNSSFNFVLAGNSSGNAGDGGSLSDQAYTGVVSVFGETPNYISWERS